VESDNTQKVNKNTIKNLAIASTLALVLLVGIVQLINVNQNGINNTALASIAGQKVFSYSAYGRALAKIIDDSVRHVYNHVPGAMVKNNDILDTMCLELGKTYLKKFADYGNIKGTMASDYGIVQFQIATFKKVVRKHNLFALPNSKSELIKLMNKPSNSVLVGAYYKNDLLMFCKRKGFTGSVARNCAAVAYNGGAGKIKAIPSDGSRPSYCYCTNSTRHLKMCQGKPILAKSQRGGKMHCITRRYGYEGLAKCQAEIAKGGGSKLKSSLWKSLIANTKKLDNGGTIASVNPNMFSTTNVKDVVSDWWNSDNGQELSDTQDGQNYEFNTNNENDVNYENTTNNSSGEYYKPKQKFIYYPPTYTYTPQTAPVNPQVSLQQEATLRQAGYTTTAPHQGAQPVGFIQVQQVNIPNSYAHTYAQPTILQRNSMYQATRQNAFVPFASGGATEISI